MELLYIPEFGIFLQCSQKAVYGSQLTFCLDSTPGPKVAYIPNLR